jgi:hypothetical protein
MLLWVPKVRVQQVIAKKKGYGRHSAVCSRKNADSPTAKPNHAKAPHETNKTTDQMRWKIAECSTQEPEFTRTDLCKRLEQWRAL